MSERNDFSDGKIRVLDNSDAKYGVVWVLFSTAKMREMVKDFLEKEEKGELKDIWQFPFTRLELEKRTKE